MVKFILIAALTLALVGCNETATATSGLTTASSSFIKIDRSPVSSTAQIVRYYDDEMGIACYRFENRVDDYFSCAPATLLAR